MEKWGGNRVASDREKVARKFPKTSKVGLGPVAEIVEARTASPWGEIRKDRRKRTKSRGRGEVAKGVPDAQLKSARISDVGGKSDGT